MNEWFPVVQNAMAHRLQNFLNLWPVSWKVQDKAKLNCWPYNVKITSQIYGHCLYNYTLVNPPCLCKHPKQRSNIQKCYLC